MSVMLSQPSQLGQPPLPPRDLFWRRIEANAKSPDGFERVASLATAAGSVEEALTASGVPRKGREGLASRAKQVTSFSPLWPSWQELQAAANARNTAVHTRIVPRPAECASHTLILYRAWCALQSAFVTRKKAAELATDLLSLDFVRDVLLFGSLTRRTSFPRDVDLLVLDDGELSFQFYDYGERKVESLLESADLSSAVNRAAERCGWLDVIVVDQDLFLHDKSYRLALAKKQKDPLFFVNIAERILIFDRDNGEWSEKRPEIFERLGSLRRELQSAGVVPPTR